MFERFYDKILTLFFQFSISLISDFHYFLNNLPKTSILHNSKDDSLSYMEHDIATSELPLCCQLASRYAERSNMQNILRTYHLEGEHPRCAIIKHISGLQASQFTSHRRGKGQHGEHSSGVKEHAIALYACRM
jgi:hypothetical protein